MKIKLAEWQDACGNWHAADVSAVGKGSSAWWLIARALGLPLDTFAEMIITKYKPDYVKYFEDKCLLLFHWKSQVAMRKFKNEINAMLRKVGAQ